MSDVSHEPAGADRWLGATSWFALYASPTAVLHTPRPRAFLFRLPPGHSLVSPQSAGIRLRRKLRDVPAPTRSNGLPSVPACLPHIPRGSLRYGAPRLTAVLSHLGISHQNLALFKVQVLDPQPHAFY